jgi:hypothetical protein
VFVVPAGIILPMERNGKPRTKTHSLVLEVAALLNGWPVKLLSIRLGICERLVGDPYLGIISGLPASLLSLFPALPLLWERVSIRPCQLAGKTTL